MLYSRLPGMIIRYADSITGDVTGKVTEMIPDEIESVMPELPTETGLPIKFPWVIKSTHRPITQEAGSKQSWLLKMLLLERLSL